MVVIDTWARFRPPRTSRGNPWDEDYQHAHMMKEVADRYGIAVKALVHTRKVKDADDWISDLTGTLGHVAAADVVSLIRRPRNATDGTLYVTGRDVEEQELAVRFDGHTGSWSVLGDAYQVRLAETKKRIVEFLSRSTEEVHYRDLAEELEITPANAKKTCQRLLREELIQRGSKPGTYKL
jgi:hypothetical protein